MQLLTLSVRFVVSIFILVSFTLATHVATSSSGQISTARELATSNSPTDTITITKRAGFNHQHTIANGWHIQYQIVQYLTPAFPALTGLKYLYFKILEEAEHRMVSGEISSAVMEITLGAFTLSFTAERGYSNVVPWYIIIEFVDQMLESTVPITYNCHIAPPGSVAGIAIKLWLGPRALSGN
ncbi:MAG: hypothetical protein LQ343_002838 [Gyalolechia ehrenbergii]|nr:MAG: hypothetical protein LQ343_002838 [Gyalolechia ehrenbergii]